MQLTGHDLEDWHTESIHEAIDAFRQRARLLSSAVFLIKHRSSRHECIADCGDFPIEVGLEPRAARAGHGCLTDFKRRFLLVWFLPCGVDDEPVLGAAKDAAVKIASVLDQFEAQQLENGRWWYGHRPRP